MPHRFDPTILREYDIRGIVGTTLFRGRRRGSSAAPLPRRWRRRGGRRVAVGYDGRLTSPELEAALVEGLAAGGADVVRIGRGPTPMLYFAAATLKVDGGVMVTGSHNPPDHNGFKMVLGGKPFYAEAIQRLGAIAASLGAPSGRAGRSRSIRYSTTTSPGCCATMTAHGRSTSPGIPATAPPAMSSRALTKRFPAPTI